MRAARSRSVRRAREPCRARPVTVAAEIGPPSRTPVFCSGGSTPRAPSRASVGSTPPRARPRGRRAAACAPLGARAREGRRGGARGRAADCRFAGQGYEVTIPAPLDDPAPLAVAFLATHRARYGHEGGGQPIELVNLRVAAVKSGGGSLPQLDGRAREQRAPRARRTATVGGARVEASVWPLGELAAGVELEGPAILAGGDATALVEPGWRGRVHRSGAILLERR